jgi:hypothetical protein
MKRYFFPILMFLFFASPLFSQNPGLPVDETTELITYQDVINETGTKEVLYNRCIEWVNTQYKNPQEATKVRDPEDGKIIIHHGIRMVDIQTDGSVVNSNTVVNYVLRLEFREGRYRYTFTDFTMKASSRYPLERWLNQLDPSYLPVYADYLLQVDKEVNEIIKGLKKGMKEKVIKEDVW